MLDCLTGYISALRSNFHSSLSQIHKFSKQIMADSRNIYILVWQMLSCLYGIQSLFKLLWVPEYLFLKSHLVQCHRSRTRHRTVNLHKILYLAVIISSLDFTSKMYTAISYVSICRPKFCTRALYHAQPGVLWPLWSSSMVRSIVGSRSAPLGLPHKTVYMIHATLSMVNRN